MDRLDGALGGHHGRRADLEDLEDVRLLAGPEGGDAGVQGLGVVALVGGIDLVVALRGVELLDHRIDDLAEPARVGVPPVDLGRGQCRRGTADQGGGRRAKCESRPCKHPLFSLWLSSHTAADGGGCQRLMGWMLRFYDRNR